MPVRRSLRRFALLALPTATAVSCADLLAPNGVRPVTPALTALAVRTLPLGGPAVLSDDDTPAPAGHYVHVTAEPVDAGFRLANDERIPMELTTASGDREALQLFRRYCPEREEQLLYSCYEFYVEPQAGEGERVLARLRAEGDEVAYTFSFAAKILRFAPEGLVPRMRDVGRWPGVRQVYVVEGGFGCAGDCPPLRVPLRGWLGTPFRAEKGPAVPRDGVVQFTSGDTLEVRYVAPGRPPVVARHVAP